MSKISIGLDFDCVILDTWQLKHDLALEVFDLDIPGYLLESSTVKAGKTPLSYDQYQQLQKLAYSDNPDIISKMQPVTDAIEGIRCLLNFFDYSLPIITARQNQALQVAEVFLHLQGLNLRCYSVGYGNSKADILNRLGCQAYVDDDLPTLLDLQSRYPTLYLFNPYADFVPAGIIKVSSWQKLLIYLKSNH